MTDTVLSGLARASLQVSVKAGEDQRLEEKGVDVALASCAVEWAVIESVDRVIIFSHDTDLSSVVEVISRIKGADAVETASWKSPSFHKRIPPIKGVNNLPLHERIFLALEDKPITGRKRGRGLKPRQRRSTRPNL